MNTTARVTTPLRTYLAEINRAPLLTAANEKELATRVLSGDAEARDRMVRANLGLVVSIARASAGKGLPIEDLVSEGNMGLLRAVEGFDPTRNTRFSTYASFWIKQSIKRALVNTARLIRLPEHMSKLLLQWHRATNHLTDELRRPPTQEEMARFLGLSKKKLAIVNQAIQVTRAGRQSDPTEPRWGLEDKLIDPRPDAPAGERWESDLVERALQFLNRMDRREATVLRLRFGLSEEEPKTLREIGESLGVTRERVRQIERGALAKLADHMGRDSPQSISRLQPLPLKPLLPHASAFAARPVLHKPFIDPERLEAIRQALPVPKAV